MRKLSSLKGWTFLAAFWVFLFATAEFAARRFYGDGFLTLVDSNVEHRRRPFTDVTRSWGSGVAFQLRTNSLGWRDSRPHHIVETRSQKKRVVLLGDSFVEGVGYNESETVSGQLQRLLGERGRDVEVLNAGMVSYSPVLEYQRLKTFLDDGYHADVVAVFPDVSDPHDELFYRSRMRFRNDGEPDGFLGLKYRPFAVFLWNTFALSRVFKQLRSGLKGFQTSRENDSIRPAQDGPVNRNVSTPTARWRELLAHPYRPDQLWLLPDGVAGALRANWVYHEPSLSSWAQLGIRHTLDGLERLRVLCEAHKIPLIVVLYPWPNHLYVRNDPAFYDRLEKRFPEVLQTRELIAKKEPMPRTMIFEKAVVDWTRSAQVPVVDLFPRILNHPSAEALYIENDIHFNPMGHAVLAESLLNEVLTALK